MLIESNLSQFSSYRDGLQADGPGSFPSEDRDFFFSSNTGPALRSAQSPVKFVPGLFR
jgi:hypothetical protein